MDILNVVAASRLEYVLLLRLQIEPLHLLDRLQLKLDLFLISAQLLEREQLLSRRRLFLHLRPNLTDLCIGATHAQLFFKIVKLAELLKHGFIDWSLTLSPCTFLPVADSS